MRRRLRGWTVAALVLGGCAARVPHRFRAVTAAELVDGLAARRAAVTTLHARARLRSGLSGLWTRQAVIVRRPDGVRIDVLSPFGLAVAVGIRGDRLWAYPPAERTRYDGDATPANLGRFLGAPVGVGDVVDLLLGVPPAREPLAAPALATTPEGEYRLTLPIADGEQTVWFTGDGLTVTRAEETRDGRLAFRVAFDEYRDGFPHRLDVAAEGGSSARLAYETVQLNAAVDAALFEPPPAPRVLSLEAVPRPAP
ncbi:MAG TPA: hypothetical protein VKA21_12205 [Candidatus Binatia bacterium]|nr:hypothetical protein [Candidatus Binatia bacterium]